MHSALARYSPSLEARQLLQPGSLSLDPPPPLQHQIPVSRHFEGAGQAQSVKCGWDWCRYLCAKIWESGRSPHKNLGVEINNFGLTNLDGCQYNRLRV
ncbi:hypothetical protein J6590_008749, partial [Homalodisca vitripennis]